MQRSFLDILVRTEYFLHKKSPVQTIKVKFQKSPIKSKFSKEVSPRFWVKNGHFSQWLFWANLARKHRFLCSGQKRMLFKQEMSGFKKVQKIELFQTGQSMVFCKNAPFFQWWYLGQSSQKRSSFEILDRKEWFQTRKVKFYVFRQKQPFFSLVVFEQIQPEKIVFFIFWIKNAIQTRKVKFYKSLRKSKFSKGVSP